MPPASSFTRGYGNSLNPLADCELYNPATGSWTTTGCLNAARSLHTATLLPTGLVFVAGGIDTNLNPLANCELYDPASGTWTAGGSLNTARFFHTATLLPNGRVLVAGGVMAAAIWPVANSTLAVIIV